MTVKAVGCASGWVQARVIQHTGVGWCELELGWLRALAGVRVQVLCAYGGVPRGVGTAWRGEPAKELTRGLVFICNLASADEPSEQPGLRTGAQLDGRARADLCQRWWCGHGL